jgi:hypothetical protein
LYVLFEEVSVQVLCPFFNWSVWFFGVLGFLGVISLVLIIYAGVKWMLAEGNEESIGEARKIIFYAIIGLAIIMGSYALSYYVINNIIESTQPGTPGVIDMGVSGEVRVGDGGGLIECVDDSGCVGFCDISDPDSPQEPFCDVTAGKCRCRAAAGY